MKKLKEMKEDNIINKEDLNKAEKILNSIPIKNLLKNIGNKIKDKEKTKLAPPVLVPFKVEKPSFKDKWFKAKQNIEENKYKSLKEKLTNEHDNLKKYLDNKTKEYKEEYAYINNLNEKYEYAIIINPDNTPSTLDVDNLSNFKYKDGRYFINRDKFKFSFVQKIKFKDKLARMFILKSMKFNPITLFKRFYRTSQFFLYQYNNFEQISFKENPNLFNADAVNIVFEQRLIEQLKAEKDAEINWIYVIVAVVLGAGITYFIMSGQKPPVEAVKK